MPTFLFQRGLAIKNDDEIIGSVRKKKYLDMLKLLSEYDDFLKQHIKKHALCGSHHTSYLYSTICKVLVQLMGKTILDEITLHLKKSRYCKNFHSLL